jgi:anti-sigma factor ChrR (cupin superfamily)
MELNADFARRVAVHAGSMAWTPSPVAGVDRRMLDRIGGEVARATSIVRYAADSRFSAHRHPGGEEFLVLDGVFQDEHGDFPAGSYIRNPPGSGHTPGSAPGCVIFVKLWQFDAADRTELRLDTSAMRFAAAEGRPGIEVKRLFRDLHEEVRLERWSANTRVTLPGVGGGLEILLLEGCFVEAGETFVEQSWLRLPEGAGLTALAGPDGCCVWIKTGRAIAPPLPDGQS